MEGFEDGGGGVKWERDAGRERSSPVWPPQQETQVRPEEVKRKFTER